MARGFGSTDGVGTTDNILVANDAALTNLQDFTVSLWSYQRGTGGGGQGRLVDKGNHIIWFNFDATTFDFAAFSWATDGRWRYTRPSLNAWHHHLLAYSYASTDPPEIDVDGVAQTLTTVSSPSGAVSGDTADLKIGNRNDDLRVWDGRHAECAVWNRKLAANEKSALAAGYAPAFFPRGLVAYVPMVRDVVDLVRGAPSVTGTAVQPHPRIIYPRRRSLVAVPAAAGVTLAGTVAAVSSMSAALRVEKRLGGTVAGASAMAAALRVEKRLAGQVAGVSTMTAALQVGGAPPVVPVPFVPAFRRRRR